MPRLCCKVTSPFGMLFAKAAASVSVIVCVSERSPWPVSFLCRASKAADVLMSSVRADQHDSSRVPVQTSRVSVGCQCRADGTLLTRWCQVALRQGSLARRQSTKLGGNRLQAFFILESCISSVASDWRTLVACSAAIHRPAK